MKLAQTLYPDRLASVERQPPASHPAGLMTWTGQPGGILVIGERPGRGEREPFDNRSGQQLRAQLERLAPGVPVAFDYAFRDGHQLTGKKSDQPALEQSRSWLHQTLQDVQPTRVLALGSDAHKALTGQLVQASIVRKAHSFLSTGCPVWYLPRPWGPTTTNRVLQRWYSRDLQHAVTEPTPPSPFGGTWREVLTVEDAQLAWEELSAAECWVFDTETFGPMHTPDFRIVCLAACAPGTRHAWVWGQDACQLADPRAQAILRLLRERPCAGHNLKYDSLACAYHFGQRPMRERWCTRLLAKLRRADGPAGLDPQAALVGMGGHKLEAKRHLALVSEVLSKLRTDANRQIPTDWAEVTSTTAAGHQRTRRVVTGSRDPTPMEVTRATHDAWVKPRTRQNVKTTVAELTGLPAPTDDWLLAVSRPDTDARAWVYGLMDRTVCHRYCARDTVTTGLLLPWLRSQIAMDSGLQLVWEEILGDATHGVCSIELAGLLVDQQALATLEAKLDQMLLDSWAVISRHAPADFNPASPDQLADWLFQPVKAGGLGLPPGGLTKTGKPCTDSQTLAGLVGRHPAVTALLDYKKAAKLQSNYARGMRRFVSADGRVHCTLNIDGAASGRLSCSAPNLQTIVSRGPLAKLVKRVFCAPAGKKLVVIDYSTLELRIIAMLAGEQSMIDVFRAGTDLHRQTAIDVGELVWGTDFHSCGLGYTFTQLLEEHGLDRLADLLRIRDEDPGAIGDPAAGWSADMGTVDVLVRSDGTKSHEILVMPDGTQVHEPRWQALLDAQKARRTVAKGVNFSVVYGQGPETLAANWGISVDVASAAQEAIMGRRKDIQRWIRDTIRNGRRVGYTRTWWAGQPARIRPLPDLGSSSQDRRSHAERAGYNSAVQGTGSDFCLASLVRLVRELERLKAAGELDAQVVLTVHDSILFECADADLPRLVQLARTIMTGHDSQGVPITVDVEVGQSWGDLEPYRG